MKQTLVLILAAAIIAAGLYVFFTRDNEMQNETVTPTPTSQEESIQDESEVTPAPAAQGKLNINVVCEGALAYMSFTDGASADAFVAECKEGKHPEVIERYKAEMNLGAGAQI